MLEFIGFIIKFIFSGLFGAFCNYNRINVAEDDAQENIFFPEYHDVILNGANTEHFFEEIHERITEWLEYFEIEQIALSCSKTLYPFLFSDDFELDRKDERLMKIPKHIPEANFENLLFN